MRRKVKFKKQQSPFLSRVRKLEQWAERTQMAGRMLFCVLLVYGLISAVIGAFYPTAALLNGCSKESLCFSPVLFVTGCMKTGIWLLIEYPLYHVLCVALYGIAGILKTGNRRQTYRFRK